MRSFPCLYILHDPCHSYYKLGSLFLIKYLFTLQQVSRSHAWRLYFFSKMIDGFQIVVNPPTPFQIYIFIIFRGVRNRDQPSDPFSDLYSFIFWVLKSLQPLMAGGRALFCPKSKMTFGTDFSGTPCIFLFVLTIIPIVTLLKRSEKHDSS